MTRNNRHIASWPLFTTSESFRPFYLKKIAVNSFARKILPVTPTHSRFCGEKFFLTQWNQDFRDTRGRGVYQLSVISCPMKNGEEMLGGGYYAGADAKSRSVPLGTLGVRMTNEELGRVHKFPLWLPSRFSTGLDLSMPCSLRGTPSKALTTRYEPPCWLQKFS
jgi:hypothetical protein